MHARRYTLRICALALVALLVGGLISYNLNPAGQLEPVAPQVAQADAKKATPTEKPEQTPEPDEEAFDEDAYMAEEEAAASQEEAPQELSEEVQFLDELLGEIDMPENALDAVNGMTNILLVGIDARPKEKTGRSDTMIIATLDSDHNCIKLTSFMRDLYVEIPGHKKNRLNAAYLWGGPKLLIQTIKQNFGIDVDHYLTVNFSTMADVIDQLGGMTLTVEKKYVPRINAVIKMDNKALGQKIESGLLDGYGERLLTGRQALAYARYRYGTPDGDFGRTVRQREVVMKLLDKIKDMSLIELGQLALQNMDKVTTDMSLADMLRLAPAVFELRKSTIKELRIPVDKSFSNQTISGMAVIVPNRSKNQKALADFLLSE